MSNSSSVTVTTFDPDQYNMSSSGGYTISLSPNSYAVPSYDFEHPRPHTQMDLFEKLIETDWVACLLYTSPSPRDATLSRMPSSA